MFTESTPQEVTALETLIQKTKGTIANLVKAGKKVHIIWDMDGVLASPRSDDVFRVANGNLETFFAYEERLLLEKPEKGPWFNAVAAQCGKLHTSQDIVTARSSFLAFRVFHFSLEIPIRWQLFLGHQPKEGAYHIILQSLKHDPAYHVFMVDDSEKHVDAFRKVSKEMKMTKRCHGILTPVMRTYDADDIALHLSRVLNARGERPVCVRDDPNNDINGVTVLPHGLEQFQRIISDICSRAWSDGLDEELRQAFIRVFGEVGEGRFKTEEELQQAKVQFLIDRHV